MNKFTTFNLTEEAFLLDSLHEVVKVWSRGSGQASFNLDISDGAADLKLCFKLGLPGDLHYVPDVLLHPPQQHLHQDHHQQVKRKRRRGPAQIIKDRARAAAHQTRLQSEAAIPVRTETAAPAAIKLPFSGNILPLIIPTVNPFVPQTVNPSTLSPSLVTAPKKSPSKSISKKYANVSAVKKQLFPLDQLPPPPVAPPQTAPPPAAPPPRPTSPPSKIKNYQKSENQLWTKLFKT